MTHVLCTPSLSDSAEAAAGRGYGGLRAGIPTMHLNTHPINQKIESEGIPDF